MKSSFESYNSKEMQNNTLYKAAVTSPLIVVLPNSDSCMMQKADEFTVYIEFTTLYRQRIIQRWKCGTPCNL